MATIISSLGFPRIGPRRELKKSLEAYWSGKINADELERDAKALRAARWQRQRALAVDHVPSNDFSLYDHVLDTSVMVGAIPSSYGWDGGEVSLDTYFAMARGTTGNASSAGNKVSDGAPREDDLPALEMTKWFDTNYHYMVPEFTAGQVFRLASTKPIDEFLEAKALGIHTRPVLVGPVTYLHLGKAADADVDPWSSLDSLLDVYVEVLTRLQAAGAAWVQIDEPVLALDLDVRTRDALSVCYRRFKEAVPGLKVLLTTYFGALGDNLDAAVALPVAGLHVDLVRAPEQLEAVLAKAPKTMAISLGVVDGRNVWRADLERLLDLLEPVVQSGRELMLAPSCSLLHTPIDLELETEIDPEVKDWLAFAVQKLAELDVQVGS